MPNIKTAISIEKPIFDQVNDLAKNLNISRSRLFVLAVQEFIQRHTNMELLQAINEAYDDLPDNDKKIVEKMRPRHLKMVKNQW
jgi:metal-responsive CopG/Arc/MetJ family transcriptional regulator